MKRIWIGVLLLSASATASAQFEGVADFRVTMTGEKRKSVPSTGKIFATKNAYRTEWETRLDAGTRAPKEGEEAATPRSFKMTMLGRLAEPDKLYLINDEKK